MLDHNMKHDASMLDGDISMSQTIKRSSDGETLCSGASSVCSSSSTFPVSGSPLDSNNYSQQANKLNRSFQQASLPLWQLNKMDLLTSEDLMSLSSLIEQSDEGESSDDELQQKRPFKRLKQTSETSVLIMMQHLSRRRNELRIIDERLLDMMNSCLNKLDSVTSKNEPNSIVLNEKDTNKDELLKDENMSLQYASVTQKQLQEPQQQPAQQNAIDLSCRSSKTHKVMHPRKSRLLGAATSSECEAVAAPKSDGKSLALDTNQFSCATSEQKKFAAPEVGMTISLVLPQQVPPQQPSPLVNHVPSSTGFLDLSTFQQHHDLSLSPMANNVASSLTSAPMNLQPSPQLTFPFFNHYIPQQNEPANQPIPVQFQFGTAQQQQQQQAAMVANFCWPVTPPGQVSIQQQCWPASRSQQAFQGNVTTSSQLNQLMKAQQVPNGNAPQNAQLLNENNSNMHQLQAINSKQQLTSDLIRPIVEKMSSFRCHVCHSCFEDRHRLQQHLSIHLELQPSWFEERTIKETMAQYESRRGDYLCQMCQLRFETTAEFDKHMQLHGDKPHQCELCQQTSQKLVSFRFFRQLLTHLRSHCFLYSCKFAPECKQTANRKDYLKLHILKHHLNNKLPDQQTICCH